MRPGYGNELSPTYKKFKKMFNRSYELATSWLRPCAVAYSKKKNVSKIMFNLGDELATGNGRRPTLFSKKRCCKRVATSWLRDLAMTFSSPVRRHWGWTGDRHLFAIAILTFICSIEKLRIVGKLIFYKKQQNMWMKNKKKGDEWWFGKFSWIK